MFRIGGYFVVDPTRAYSGHTSGCIYRVLAVDEYEEGTTYVEACLAVRRRKTNPVKILYFDIKSPLADSCCVIGGKV